MTKCSVCFRDMQERQSEIVTTGQICFSCELQIKKYIQYIQKNKKDFLKEVNKK